MKQIKIHSVKSKNRQTQKQALEVLSFYRFIHFDKAFLKKIRPLLLRQGEQLGIRGLILLSPEGINVAVSGAGDKVLQYLSCVEKTTGIRDFFYKKSYSDIYGFKKLRIKLKAEISAMGVSVKDSQMSKMCTYLEPKEWESMLNAKQAVVLDIRNDYEVEIGRFKGAKAMNLKEFQEFPKSLKNLDLAKEDKTLIYCTGGIRCEKAVVEMKQQGFSQVYQLKGGIINYLKEYPKKNFEGECFVFDHRVALDQNLKASRRYVLCPHCGQPAEQDILCAHCGKEAKVCAKCLSKNRFLRTCSKNCVYHFRSGHRCKKPVKRMS